MPTVPNQYERVAARAGAELLDERMPGWWQRIDLEILDLFDSARCVLGQLFAEDRREVPMWIHRGYDSPEDARSDFPFTDVEALVCDANYALGKHVLGLDADATRECGFNADFTRTHYSGLDLAWAEIIRSRQNPEKKELSNA